MELDRDAYINACKFLKDTCGISMVDYGDRLLFALTGKPVLDVFKFDDYLHERFGNYESEGQNMEQCIQKNFTAEQAGQLNKLLLSVA